MTINILFLYALTISSIINMVTIWFLKPLGKIRDTAFLANLIIILIIFSLLIFFFNLNSNILLNIIIIFILLFILNYIFIIKNTIKYAEFFNLIIFLIISILILLLEFNLINIYLALEMQAMLFYTLIAAKAKTKNALESAIKYFVFNVLASIVFLFGISYFYSLTGSTDINFIVNIIDIHDFGFLLGSFLIMFAFIIKLGIYPFHNWLIDIYHGAPLHILLLLLNIPKIIFYILIFFFNILISSKVLNLILAIITIFFGFIKSIFQVNLQRFFAYTAIGSNGYFLGLTTLSDFFTFISLIFSLLIYILISFLTLLITFSLRQARNFFSTLYHIFLLKKSHFSSCICFIIVFLNSSSIPPLAGFYQKLILFFVFIRANDFIFLLALILSSIIVTLIYLRLVTFILFHKNIKVTFILFKYKYVALVISFISLLFITISLYNATYIYTMCQIPFDKNDEKHKLNILKSSLKGSLNVLDKILKTETNCLRLLAKTKKHTALACEKLIEYEKTEIAEQEKKRNAEIAEQEKKRNAAIADLEIIIAEQEKKRNAEIAEEKKHNLNILLSSAKSYIKVLDKRLKTERQKTIEYEMYDIAQEIWEKKTQEALLKILKLFSEKQKDNLMKIIKVNFSKAEKQLLFVANYIIKEVDNIIIYLQKKENKYRTRQILDYLSDQYFYIQNAMFSLGTFRDTDLTKAMNKLIKEKNKLIPTIMNPYDELIEQVRKIHNMKK